MEQQADGQMLSSETNKQGCYFSVELHLAFRDQPKMSVNRSISQKSFFRSCIYESGLIRVSRGIYLLIYLRRWKALGSSQDVINLKEEIMASQMVQEEMSGLSHHRLWNKNRLSIHTHLLEETVKNMYVLCSISLNRSKQRNWTKRLYVAGYKHKD